MSTIKDRRRNNRLQSHPALCVGDCVPFYFCPRSVMLYLLFRGNHPDLDYQGGQEPILHLQFDLQSVHDWAEANSRRWALTLGNAGARFFEDRDDLSALDELNWDAIRATDFRNADIKEGKQAEFLVESSVPWGLVEEIGIHSRGPRGAIQTALAGHRHRPPIVVRPNWYY